jgi:hypothetical protein
MTRIGILLILLMLSVSAQLQTISPVSIKSDENGKGKQKKAPKKIYIADFRVNYQIMHIAQDFEAGDKNANDGYASGDIKVILAIALTGLSNEDLQGNTDFLYKQFTQKLKDKGYEIVGADAASGIKEFKGWERKTGGNLNKSQYKGFITSTPTGFEYYVKGTTSSGREKNTFTDNSAKISHQLDNVTVAKVNLFLPMAENGESWGSSAFLQDALAKVVLETNLSLDDDIEFNTKGGGFAKTGVSFINSEAMGLPTSMNVYSLKKPIEISGVIEKKKYKIQGMNQGSMAPFNAGPFYVLEVNNVVKEKTIPVPVDPTLYNSGVRMACEAFINNATDQFFENAF